MRFRYRVASAVADAARGGTAPADVAFDDAETVEWSVLRWGSLLFARTRRDADHGRGRVLVFPEDTLLGGRLLLSRRSRDAPEAGGPAPGSYERPVRRLHAWAAGDVGDLGLRALVYRASDVEQVAAGAEPGARSVVVAFPELWLARSTLTVERVGHGVCVRNVYRDAVADERCLVR